MTGDRIPDFLRLLSGAAREPTPEEAAEEEVRRQLSTGERRRRALCAAILAARECPADLVEWGQRHGIPEFATATWQAGFAAGMRFALSEVDLPPPEPPEREIAAVARALCRVIECDRASECRSAGRCLLDGERRDMFEEAAREAIVASLEAGGR